jgi:predicted ribosome quality control (RQC) complex YloA/Tae2 family protein
MYFVSPSGYSVMVGRNARENHHLSTQVLKGNDLWFHAANSSGAHVIMRLEKGNCDLVSEADLEFCKDLARKYSKSESMKAKVHVARGVDVTYVKGQRKGTVCLSVCG